MSKKTEKDRSQHIQVYVRCRPQNASEKKSNSQIVVEAVQETREIIVKERLCDKDYSKKFTFDRVFGPENTQLDVYKTVANPCIEEVLMGYNCTVFAYGQTGTGKTYTMQGMKSSEIYSWEDDPEAGIIPRTLHQLFDELKNRFQEFTVRVSFLEIYNEELFDLLSSMNDGMKLRLYDDVMRKGSVVIQGLSEVTVHSKEEVFNIMELGSNRRRTASTLMNADSSRSHTVFTITVHIREYNLEGEELLKTGKMNLVDLAGSECVGRSGAVDRRAREAGSINQSLLTLGRVITALIEKTPHIPYRESKLTRLLQDSLGGRTKTSIIATVSPAQCNLEETLSTLDYAHRAKNITNKPEINQKMTKDMLIKEYVDEIQKLKADLRDSREKNGIYVDEENYRLIFERTKMQKEEIEQVQAAITLNINNMENTKKIFSDTEGELNSKIQELEATSARLSETLKQLDCTSELLLKRIEERDEQLHLVNRHVKTEKMLLEQSQRLLSVVNKSTGDAESLHAKLESMKDIENKNLQQTDNFHSDLQGSMAHFLDTFNTSVSQQKQCDLNLSGLFAGTKAVFQKHSQEMDDVFSAILACHQNDIGVQSEKAMQKEENVRKFNAILQKESSHFLNTMSRMENEYLSEQYQTLFADIHNLLHNQNNDIENFKASVEHELDNYIENLECNSSKTLGCLADLSAMVENVVVEQSPKIDLCQNNVEDVTSGQDELFKNISSWFNELDKFATISTSSKEVLDHRMSNMDSRIAEMSVCLDQLRECKETLPIITQSAKLSLESTGIALQDSCTKTVGILKSEMKELVDKDEVVSDKMSENLSKLAEEISLHSDKIQEEVEIHQQRIANSIENQLKEKLQGLLEEKSDLEEFQQIVQHGMELHKNVLKKHEILQEETTLKQEAVVNDMLNAIDSLKKEVEVSMNGQDQCLDQFLHEELVRSVSTGLTPARKDYSYPRTLVSTSPHSKILQDLRLARYLKEAQNLPLPDETESERTSVLESSSSSTAGEVSSTNKNEANFV